MSFTSKNIYSFDDVTIDCENFRVQKQGQSVTLTPRAFDVLVFLIRNDRRVVDKQELFEKIWKDAFVSDNALTKIIKEIRHALEDSAEQPRYIETVPKRGYRFIGEIKTAPDEVEIKGLNSEQTGADKEAKPTERIVQSTHPSHPSRYFPSKPLLTLAAVCLISMSALIIWLWFYQKAAGSASLPIRSIAVLPFKPLNVDSRDESLEMGMAEALITRLSNVNQVVVRPMNTIRDNVEQDAVKTGEKLQVEAVLDGSIQKAGERIRVTVRLINVRTGKQLWSEQFDENFTDIFKVQDSIADRVTNALTIQLSRQEKELLVKHSTNDPEAYQLYLRGQLLWHRRQGKWIQQSMEYYQQALEKDPNFALAHIGVADCYIMMSGHRRISMQEAEKKARPSIMKALELDNTLAQAHNALAELKYQYEFDWAGAEKEFITAVELNPNAAWIRQAYGWFLMSAARFDEATVQMEKARELDPSSLTINIGRGRLFYYSRQYDQAIRHFQNIAAVEPNDSSVYYSLYAVYKQKQMYPEAVEAFLKSMSVNQGSSEQIEKYREAFRVAGWQGFQSKQLENLEEAAKVKTIEPFAFASLYINMGNKEEALTYLEKTTEKWDPAIIQLKIEPAYDLIRDDPRYAALIRKIGLQP